MTTHNDSIEVPYGWRMVDGRIVADEGERTGTVRYGFTVDANGKLVPNAAEQAVLTQVRALRDAGLSQREIVAELRLAGLISEDSQ